MSEKSLEDSCTLAVLVRALILSSLAAHRAHLQSRHLLSGCGSCKLGELLFLTFQCFQLMWHLLISEEQRAQEKTGSSKREKERCKLLPQGRPQAEVSTLWTDLSGTSGIVAH